MNNSDLELALQRARVAGAHPILAARAVHYYCRRGCADTLARFHVYNYPHKIIFLAGMGVSGSTWMKNLLSGIPGYYSRRMNTPADVHYQQNITDATFDNLPKHGYSFFKTHLNPSPENLDVLSRHGVHKILITMRDLRDVVVGRYRRLLDVPKSRTAPDFIDYRSLPKEEALDNSIDLVATEFVNWIETWKQIADADPDRFLLVRFEDLKQDTRAAFEGVLRFYGINLTEQQVSHIIERAKGRQTFNQNWKASQVLPFGLSSNFRSGKIGQWRQELTPRQIQDCRERLGPVLVRLGYEKDLNW